MATNTLGAPDNLLSIDKCKGPNGEFLEITHTIVEANDMLKDFSAKPSNGGLTHQGVRTLSYPEGEIVEVGGAWGSGKMETQPFTEGLFILRKRYTANKDALKLEGAGVASYLASQRKAFLYGLSQGWARLMIRGSSTPKLKSIVGLQQRAPYNYVDNEFTYSATAAGADTDLRSAWLIAPGNDTIHTLYNPELPTAGIEFDDKGEMPYYPLVSGQAYPDTTKWSYQIVHEYGFIQGLCLKDQRAVKRIANIQCDSTNLLTPDEDLVTKILVARAAHTVVGDVAGGEGLGGGASWSPSGGKQWFLYCDPKVYTKMLILLNRKLLVYSDQNVYHTSMLMFGDIVIRRMDALDYTAGAGETRVTNSAGASV